MFKQYLVSHDNKMTGKAAYLPWVSMVLIIYGLLPAQNEKKII